MSFSDQQGCPQIFNIRPIDLHYVFSVFPSQNLPKAAENALSRQAILHAANDLPMPMPIHHPAAIGRWGNFFLPKWRAPSGSGNSPGAPPRSQESPKKEGLFFCVFQRNPTMAGVTDGIFPLHLCHHPLAKHKHWRFMTSARARFTKLSVKKMGLATGFMTHLHPGCVTRVSMEVIVVRNLVHFTYLRDLQPTYIRVIIHFLSSMDIPVWDFKKPPIFGRPLLRGSHQNVHQKNTTTLHHRVISLTSRLVQYYNHSR